MLAQNHSGKGSQGACVWLDFLHVEKPHGLAWHLWWLLKFTQWCHLANYYHRLTWERRVDLIVLSKLDPLTYPDQQSTQGVETNALWQIYVLFTQHFCLSIHVATTWSFSSQDPGHSIPAWWADSDIFRETRGFGLKPEVFIRIWGNPRFVVKHDIFLGFRS